jgi:hypothetical protein
MLAALRVKVWMEISFRYGQYLAPLKQIAPGHYFFAEGVHLAARGWRLTDRRSHGVSSTAFSQKGVVRIGREVSGGYDTEYAMPDF